MHHKIFPLELSLKYKNQGTAIKTCFYFFIRKKKRKYMISQNSPLKKNKTKITFI